MNIGKQRSIVIFQLVLCLILALQLISVGPSKVQPTSAMLDAPVSIQVLSSSGDVKDAVLKEIDTLRSAKGRHLESIERIVVSDQDLDFLAENGSPCNGHLLGAIGNGTIILKESGTETNRRTLYHEIGHNVWAQLSEEQKKSWPFIEPFVSFYASTSVEEDFAESYSCLMTDFDGCTERLSQEKRFFLEQI